MEITKSLPIAVLDANVLYGNVLRNFLLWLAFTDVYIPQWSQRIQDEWTRNRLKNKPDLTVGNINKITENMSRSFPKASVTTYEELEESLKLPDTDDTHVLAAAIKSKATVIVTENTKHFPSAFVDPFRIKIRTADQFVTMLIIDDKEGVMDALEAQRKSFLNPPQTIPQMLYTLEQHGLTQSVRILKDIYT